MSGLYEQFIGETVVLDIAHPIVYVGRLAAVDRDVLRLEDADVHDLAPGSVSKEMYVMACAKNGVQANRKSVTVRLEHMISLSPLSDIVKY